MQPIQAIAPVCTPLIFISENWETNNALIESINNLDSNLSNTNKMLVSEIYNLAKNVYVGKNGFLQLMFKMGFAF